MTATSLPLPQCMARRDRLRLPENARKLSKPEERRTVAPPDARLDLPGDGGGVGRLNARNSVDEFDAQIKWLALLFIVVLLGLLGKLYHLQIVKGAEFYKFSDRNFIRVEELTPDRGLILDATGQILAENRPVYDVYVTPEILRYRIERLSPDAPDPISLLAEIVNLTPNAAETLRERVHDTTRRADILVARNISRDALARVVTAQGRLPGTFIHTTQQRHYPLDEVASHLLGYMNEVSAQELEQVGAYGYHAGEYIGRAGIEQSYEAILRGAPGLRRDVVDVRGHAQNLDVAKQLLGAYREVAPVPGKNLVLTLDTRLQEIIDDIGRDQPSLAVVAVDPRDGAVLALYSRPGFNPNAWSGRLSREEKREIDDNAYHPLINKSLYSWAPGSTYKIVSAIAALEEGVFDADTKVRCTGATEYGGRTFRCHNRRGHGWVDLHEAVRVSCDVYFYEAGIRLGMDTLADHGYNFGFGQRSGIGVGSERAGLVPTREWHNTHTRGGFVGGFTLGAVIGQDVVQTSPLQMALAYAAVANGGKLYYPRLVNQITTTDGRVVFEYPRRVRNTLPYSRHNLDLLVQSLIAVVDTGSARWQPLGYVDVAGKTGTAQVASLERLRFRDDEIIWEQRDHAWFAAFAPVENPRIAIAVLVEHGGSGSAVATPIALRIIDRYFRDVMGWDTEVRAALTSSSQRGPLEELLPTFNTAMFSAHPMEIGTMELLSRHSTREPTTYLEPIQ